MAGQILGATYYPSCVVNLQLRFDTQFIPGSEDPDGLAVDQMSANPPTIPTAPNGGLLIFDYTGPDKASHLLARIPKKCSVELPAYRQAGKFRLTFDYRDLPIDPRLMRAAGVKIYMDSVQADDFAKSVPSVNPSSRMSMLKAAPENLVMQGIVDSWHVSHTNSGSEVTIEGRDLVGMFLNTPVTAFAISQIKLGRQIDDVIRDLIKPMQGWAAGLQVLAAPKEEWPDNAVPFVGEAITKQVATPKVRQVVTTGALRLSTGADPDKLNFWDVITRWCYYVGGVPYITVQPDAQFQGPVTERAQYPYKTTLMIRPANSLYTQWYATDETPMKPPFKDGKRRQVGDVSYAVRRMMFGRNISDLSFERKYTGHNIPKIVTVVSYDPSSKSRGAGRTIEVSYPTEVVDRAVEQNAALYEAQKKARLERLKDPSKAKPSRVSPSGEIAAQDVIRWPIKGITDKAKLLNYAKQIYNEICRGEMGGSCQTKSLSSFGAGNEDPDLVRLRPGDGVKLVVDQRPLEARAPNVSPLAAQHQQSREQMAKDLEKRLGDKNLANAIATSLTNSLPAEMNTYRVSNVKFDWDISSGIAIAFDFHNFIAIRDDVTETAANPTAAATPGAATAVSPPKKK